ncbi:MAG: hypothetical protein KDD38_10035, partial [Bdellovibrionales bacterium]|nr:hypothetical protein [Bdellovibrionales bacterium]
MYSLRAQNKAQKWHLLTKILSLVVMVSSLPASAAKSPINNDILNELATSGALKTSNSRVIIDNDEAFRKKISNIQSAQSGDEIDMIYYIYANDFSSSVISYELIQAAQRGVKVRLLVDYLTNFKNIDTLLMLEQKGTTASGAKNIEVRLFGKPSKKIIADAVFLTTSCDTGMDGCIDRKREKAALLQDGGDGTDYMSRLFLAGLFAKNAGALKIAVIEGQEIDPSQFKSDEPMSAEDLKDLKKLGRLIFKAKVKGEMMAKLQLFFAMIAYEDEVMPIYNLVTTSLPISSDDDSAREWTYLTDYTHHKIML